MKTVLFIGLSSFTGFHFVKRISKNKNYKIYCTLTKDIKKYDSFKKKRILAISKNKNVQLLPNMKFGNKKFLNLLDKLNFNIICFHYAYTKNYNNAKFDFKKSLNNNLNNLDKVFSKISKKTLVIISNTIFQDIKQKRYKSFSNYGVSKSITYKKIKKLCNFYKIKYKSIYIPNPWGILEEKKLNYYLIKNWLNGKEPVIKFYKYIRDNIYIDKLSNFYNKILKSKQKIKEYFPSGQCSSNKVFVEYLRQEFEKFFKIETKVKYLTSIKKQDQPLIRINGVKILKKINNKEKLKDYFNYYKKLLNK